MLKKMLDMQKLMAALVFAAIAGLTAMVAGLMNDVRVSVILLRVAGVFLLTGAIVYVGIFLFEKFGYGKLIKSTEQAIEELEIREKLAGEAGEAGQPAAPVQQGQADGGFQPLQADSLRKVAGGTEN